MKKIFLVSQNQNDGYDTYDSFVIVCNNEDEARNTNPEGAVWDGKTDVFYFNRSVWVEPSEVNVSLIGMTDLYNENTIICSSFNSG